MYVYTYKNTCIHSLPDLLRMESWTPHFLRSNIPLRLKCCPESPDHLDTLAQPMLPTEGKWWSQWRKSTQQRL